MKVGRSAITPLTRRMYQTYIQYTQKSDTHNTWDVLSFLIGSCIHNLVWLITAGKYITAEIWKY